MWIIFAVQAARHDIRPKEVVTDDSVPINSKFRLKEINMPRMRGFFCVIVEIMRIGNTTSASLTTFSTGVCFVWTSPIIPKFQSEDVELNPIGRPVTITESAWIVAAMTLGLMIGPILAVLALRILMGIGSGAVWSVLGTFIAEIAENKNRGFLGSFPGIASNIGSLSVYVIGPYTKIWQFSIVQIVPIILFCMTFGFLVPDSPYDLIVRGKSDLAEKSLKKLRQTDKTQSIDIINKEISQQIPDMAQKVADFKEIQFFPEHPCSLIPRETGEPTARLLCAPRDKTMCPPRYVGPLCAPQEFVEDDPDRRHLRENHKVMRQKCCYRAEQTHLGLRKVQSLSRKFNVWAKEVVSNLAALSSSGRNRCPVNISFQQDDNVVTLRLVLPTFLGQMIDIPKSVIDGNKIHLLKVLY
ncbi:hypothetical protein HUJ05_000752 [Dendroctonus ponderosae]|nr:hypothetical protein HUJ05_000752 [Dendroctonus ponderosae]